MRNALLLAIAAALAARAEFRLRDINAASLELSENGVPVLVYNHGTMLKEGAPPDRARCCYVHPVYAPNGAIVTDDFPRDHYHHRGISWMWPVVRVDGQEYDLWTIRGIHARFEKWIRKEASAGKAVIAVQNGWYVGDRKVVEEQVEITAFPSSGNTRDLAFAVRITPVVPNVEIAGSPESNKGYGGFSIRFSPRTQTRLDSATGADVPDSDLKPNAWAQLTGDFGGKVASTRITIDPENPGAPNGWCLRHYGFLGVNFPGLQPYRLDANAPLAMNYRVTLTSGARQSSRKHVLVYTRNGKGYVHDNIADSVAAIRKMGDEAGFTVDASDDPNLFTDANLKQYNAIVFSNSNNEAFLNDAHREAFQRFIRAGGGFVGIHSASGSERKWPYYWTVLGGSFLRHPPLQKFTIAVRDPSHPATRGMPATFEWEDECYFNTYLNPNLHPLLTTDPSKLNDKDREKYRFELVGASLPLAWTLTEDGGRQFYTALGHKKEHYSNPLLYRHILNGILWTMGERGI